MKKTLTVILLLAGAVPGYSQPTQGEVTFDNSNGPKYKFATYGVNTVSADNNALVTYGGYSVAEEQGNTSADIPAGPTVYSSTGLLDSAAGIGCDAQLLAVAGMSQPLNSLIPVGAVLSYTTSPLGPGFLQSAENDPIPGTSSASPVATIAIAAWNNDGGTINTLAAAQAAGEPWGISELSNIRTTFTPFLPASMSTASNLELSFSLGASEVPEPGAIVCGIMGAFALLFRRRK